MRTIEDTRQKWDTFFRDHSTISDLRNAFKCEQGANSYHDGLRSICWKAFLLFEDLDRTQWRQKTLDSREAYSALREHFLKYIENSADLYSAIDPLTDDEKSPWHSLRRDETIRAEIFQDVDRCLQEREFFREPAVKTRMLDILFIYSKLSPDLGYRQGMHELLAPILWVIDQDAIERASLETSSSATGDDDLMLQCLDSAYVEHDSFMLFCSVMQTARIYYEFDDQRSPNGQVEVIPIVNRCQHVQDDLLAFVDQGLAEHLQAIEVLPQIFLTRWMRLLFGREFPFDDVLMVWDLLFADGLRADLIDYVCTAMLLRVHWQLLNADYSSALLLLLHYPSPEPHAPLTFVNDALYLEQSPTPRRGEFLISKYSGKPPESSKRPRRLGVRSSSARKIPLRNDSRDTSDSGSSRMSARSSPNLETLLQDVSESFQRRTESWGVAKAVRGAVGEAKRNMQLVHTENNFGIPTANDKLPPKIPGDVTSAHEPRTGFDVKVEHMEERNRALAKRLSQALDDLRSQLTNAKGLDVDTGNAMKETFTSIQSVQECLEDPSSPIGSLDRLPDTSDKTRQTGGSTGVPERDGGNHPSKKTKPVVETSPLPSDRNPKKVGHPTPSHNREPAFPIRAQSTTARPSLAESEFSWMLEGGRPLAGFVSSSSETPEQARHNGTKSKQNSLFGGGGEESQRRPSADIDELAMRSLRGPKSQK